MKFYLHQPPLWRTIMRITFSQILIFAFLTGVTYSKPTSAQVVLEKRINLSAEQRTLADILKTLAKTNQVQFIYNKDVIQTTDKLSVQFSNEALKNVLDQLLTRYNINYQVFKNKIILIDAEKIEAANKAGKAPVIMVTGKVVDEKDQPLIGVSITIKGTTRGTVTDPDGNFKLQVNSADDILVFKFIGYATYEVKAGSASPLTIKMATSSKSLNEVVVVGYGTQRTSEITGAVGSITDKSFKDQPVSTIGEAMAAKIAGVEVQQTTGKPGAALTVRVRGAGSISAGNQPLYVLDGFPLADPTTLNLISNDDIASIEVLKDASAAAIYGSRGGNGVVLITTKKGVDGKTRFNFNATGGVSMLSRHLPMLNAAQFDDVTLQAYNTAYLDKGGNPATPVASRGYSLASIFFDQSQWNDTDWQNVITQNGPFNNYQLSASGGNGGTRYYLSGGYLQQDGVVKYTSFKRYSLRSNLESNILPNLKVGLNLAPSFTNERAANTEGTYANATSEGIIMLSVLTQPLIGPYQSDGSYTRPVVTGNASSRNPLALLKEITDYQKTLRALGNLYVEWEPVKGLTLRTSGGADVVASRRDYYRPTTVPSSGVSVANGFNNTAQNLNLLWENTANYKATFANDHKLELLAGYTVQWNDNETNSIVGSGYPNDAVTTVNAATTRVGTENIEQWALLSLLGRVNYSYKGKYLLTANIRRDGSSRFGVNTQYGVFPSASVGWRISDETFLKNVNWLNDLKLRASYGLTGNNNIANYGSIGLISQDNYVFGTGTGTLTGGLAPSSIANPDLRWEKNVQTDLGIETSILHDRLQITADYYNRKSSDLLLNLQVPAILGFTTALVNIGEVQNKGFEFTVNSHNLVGALQWTTNFNISFNRNKVLNTGPQGTPIFTGSYVANINVTQVGSVIGSFYGYKAIGIFNTQDEVNNYPHFSSTRPGDIKFEDVNHDGVLDAHDMTLLGNNQPDFTYGMTNTFQYKNFDLNFVIQGVKGNQIADAFAMVIKSGTGGAINQETDVLNAWQSPSQPGNGIQPRLNASATGNNNLFSSRFIEDGSYFRLRTVTLGYTLPTNLAARIKMRSARFYVSGENLFTITKYTGFNPEVGTAGDNATQPGVDYGAYPISRVFTVGANISF